MSLLQGVQQVAWSSLSHAYGPADNVPGLLRELLSPEQEKRQWALGELFSCICHQGTIYDASVAAVPFLIELLAAPETPDKSDIACLLASIGAGCGYYEAHSLSFSDLDWRDILAQEGLDLDEVLAEEARIDAEARRAVRPGLPLLLPFLNDPVAEVRLSVALALSYHPDLAASFLPALEEALAKETDSEAREAIRYAIQRLRQPQAD